MVKGVKKLDTKVNAENQEPVKKASDQPKKEIKIDVKKSVSLPVYVAVSNIKEDGKKIKVGDTYNGKNVEKLLASGSIVKK
jgi:hypothetical protein